MLYLYIYVRPSADSNRTVSCPRHVCSRRVRISAACSLPFPSLPFLLSTCASVDALPLTPLPSPPQHHPPTSTQDRRHLIAAMSQADRSIAQLAGFSHCGMVDRTRARLRFGRLARGAGMEGRGRCGREGEGGRKEGRKGGFCVSFGRGEGEGWVRLGWVRR